MQKYIELLRVPQWIKNLFVFVPVLFAKQLFNLIYFQEVLLAFLAFCFASSAVYILNDLIDVEEDKVHPTKKYRPIPSGKISRQNAVVVMVLLFLCITAVLFLLNLSFILILLGYMILNVLYSLVLKNMVIVDILSIAAGFMLRVIGGAFVISVYISSWLILTTLFISLFLAIMKRRSELGLHPPENNHNHAITRKVLSEYSIEFTEQMASISAAGVIICYALYSVSDRTVIYLKDESMVFTTIFVVFGIFRFMYLVYKKSKGENATEIMLTDIPMIINIVLYVITSIYIVYF